MGRKRPREQTVLEIIQTNGKVTRKEVMTALKISGSTVNRLLDGMEAKGTIKREGQLRGTFYVAVGET